MWQAGCSQDCACIHNTSSLRHVTVRPCAFSAVCGCKHVAIGLQPGLCLQASLDGLIALTTGCNTAFLQWAFYPVNGASAALSHSATNLCLQYWTANHCNYDSPCGCRHVASGLKPGLCLQASLDGLIALTTGCNTAFLQWAPYPVDGASAALNHSATNLCLHPSGALLLKHCLVCNVRQGKKMSYAFRCKTGTKTAQHCLGLATKHAA